MNIIAAIQNTISISQFNRGLAGKIFQDVKNSGAKVVMKNNAPECVLLSPDEYVSLMDEVNDARLLTLAVKRMEKFNPEETIPEEKVMKDLGITDDDLLVLKAIKKVKQNPLPVYEGGYGKPLGNKNGNDLTGFLKVKLKSAGLRVVYKVVKQNDKMLIIVIGARADEEVYGIAQKRIQENDL